jgi:hypothetical protein
MKFRMLSLLPMALLGAAPAYAQFAPPGPAQADMAIDAEVRTAVVDTLTERLTRLYLFPDQGKTIARALHKRLAAHEYDRVTSAREFADSLTQHLRAANHDLHLRVGYRQQTLPMLDAQGVPNEEERRKEHELERRLNFGFEQLRRMPGNVGYLDLRMFSGDPAAQEVAVATMNWLANTDALIIDLRRNGGGDPVLLNTIVTYLTPTGSRLHINDFYQRDGDRIEQFYTSPYLPGPRYTGKPVYVLTSHLTGSCAEEFAYDVQNMKLATLMGTTTAGAAHPGGMVRLSEHFAAFIPTGRPINPVTKTDWEGVGVKPELQVPPADALREAHVALLKVLREKAGADVERVARYDRAMEEAKQAPAEPADDFERHGPHAPR